jgi:hypothetical protein
MAPCERRTGLWRRGLCQGVWGERPCCNSSDEQWVMGCRACGRNFCGKNIVDACRRCALPICDRCWYEHNIDVGVVGHCAGTPQTRTLEEETGIPVLCRHCGDHLDFGISQHCEGCNARHCLNMACASQVLTTHCCNKEMCGPCAGWVQVWAPHGLREWRCRELHETESEPIHPQGMSLEEHRLSLSADVTNAA